MDFIIAWLLGFFLGSALFGWVIRPQSQKVKEKAVYGRCFTCKKITESELVRMDDTWRRGFLGTWHRVPRFEPRCADCKTFRREFKEANQPINYSRR